MIVSPGDPLTIVDGFVRLPDQSPVAGATVVVEPGTRSATTDADGRFEITGVPTQLGDLTVTARATVSELDPARNRATLRTTCTVGSTVVIDGEAVVLVPSQAQAAE